MTSPFYSSKILLKISKESVCTKPQKHIPITSWYDISYTHNTAQKIKFSIKDLFSKCDQIRSFLRIWSHLPKKSLKKNLFFCAVLALLGSRKLTDKDQKRFLCLLEIMFSFASLVKKLIEDYCRKWLAIQFILYQKSFLNFASNIERI